MYIVKKSYEDIGEILAIKQILVTMTNSVSLVVAPRNANESDRIDVGKRCQDQRELNGLCTTMSLRSDFLSLSASIEVNFDCHHSASYKIESSQSFWQRIVPKFAKKAIQKYTSKLYTKLQGDTRDGSGNRSWCGFISRCTQEVLSDLSTSHTSESKRPNRRWEILYDEIDELNFRLGEGGQGAVSLGMYQNTLVAVKKVKRNRDTDLDHLKELRHPNIVHFLGVCSQAEQYFIVMEYCPYGDLYGALHVHGQSTPSNVVKWSKGIAAGMEYLHKHRIIHCDLKSPNILIGRKSNVKIIDFCSTGGSKALRRPESNQRFMYTAAWSSPENIRKESSCYTGDVWSYGVVLWELLTCEVPYKNLHPNMILYGVAQNRIGLPIARSLPKGYRRLIEECQNHKPQKRPSFKQIIRRLETACSDLLSFSEKAFCLAQAEWNTEVGLDQSNEFTNPWLKANRELSCGPIADFEYDRYAWHYYTGILETGDKPDQCLDEVG